MTDASPYTWPEFAVSSPRRYVIHRIRAWPEGERSDPELVLEDHGADVPVTTTILFEDLETLEEVANAMLKYAETARSMEEDNV